MQNVDEYRTNHYHDLVIELQNAKAEGHIFDIKFLEHNVLVIMATHVSDEKISEVAQHISKKYRIYTETSISSKTITIYDAYTLDPKV